MSDPIDPTRHDPATDPGGTSREIRRRGRLFGLAYAFGIRFSELPDAAPEPSPPPLLPGSGHPALPGAPEGEEPPEHERTDPRGAEGGK